MRVNQLDREIGVNGDTVRFYTRIGFLNPVKDPVNGYKEYSPKDRRFLRFILSARQLGFSVNDIGQPYRPIPSIPTIMVRRLHYVQHWRGPIWKLSCLRQSVIILTAV